MSGSLIVSARAVNGELQVRDLDGWWSTAPTVMEVLDGSPVSEMAVQYGVSRQWVYSWRDRYSAGGIDGAARRLPSVQISPSRLPASVEALVHGLRRVQPRWDARRIAFEAASASWPGARHRRRRPRRGGL